jgi:hypothetical protein
MTCWKEPIWGWAGNQTGGLCMNSAAVLKPVMITQNIGKMKNSNTGAVIK